MVEDITAVEPAFESSEPISENCLGDARCISGTVTKIIDGNTIHVDDQSVRFALSPVPDVNGFGGKDSRDFIQTICPVGSDVIVDEDDGQTPKGYSKVIGVIYCNDMVLNKEELLDADLGYLESRFCTISEFAMTSWALKHGCAEYLSEEN